MGTRNASSSIVADAQTYSKIQPGSGASVPAPAAEHTNAVDNGVLKAVLALVGEGAPDERTPIDVGPSRPMCETSTIRRLPIFEDVYAGRWCPTQS